MAGKILEGKVALVTGASRTVGRGIAYRFAQEGAHVLVGGRNINTIEPLIDGWKKQGLSAEPAVADISDSEAMLQIIERTKDKYGSLDILVNNTVIHPEKGERGPFLKVTAEAWRQFMAQNLDALFFTTQHAARIMARQRSGNIINISSNGAVQAHRQRIPYDTLKGAVEAFTRAVAVDLAPWKVRVNSLRICAIWDAPEPGSPKEALEKRLGAMIPAGRIARPSDAAWAAVFLASDESEFITGECLNLDGGMMEQSRPPELELEPVVGPENLEV